MPNSKAVSLEIETIWEIKEMELTSRVIGRFNPHNLKEVEGANSK